MPAAPRIFFVLLLLALASAAQANERWPRFQGPPADGLLATELPLQWSPSEKIAWQAKLPGYGQSSPVVWDGRVFVTAISGEMKEACHVAAFDLHTGKQLWQRDFKAASQAENNGYVSKAAPTPVVDQVGLVVLFEGGNLVSLSHAGDVRWQRNLVEELGPIESRHGLGASLEQDAERTFVWIERSEAPYVLAVSKATGETVWKAEGLGVTSWSSPRLAPVEEGQHLVLSGIGKLAGLDPQSGKRLWEFSEIAGNSTPTPVPVEKGAFLIGATAGREAGGGDSAAASNGVIEIERQVDGTFAAKWRWRAARATSSFGSPIAHQGYAYFVNRVGVLYCLDIQSGEEQYAKRTASSIWATPLAIDDRLYLFGRDGTTTVTTTGPKFKRLAENHLQSDTPSQAIGEADAPIATGGPVLYAAVAIDDRFLIRTGDTLYLISK